MKTLFFFLIFPCLALGQLDTTEFNQMVDQWHTSAAKADSVYFFDFMHEEAVYLGTAPGERWTKQTFYTFAIPYFRRGQAWDFKAKSRHWNMSADGNTAWFDEVLETWMEECQSTGILVKENGEWQLIHYQLSVLIENEKIKQFIELRKSDQENE